MYELDLGFGAFSLLTLDIFNERIRHAANEDYGVMAVTGTRSEPMSFSFDFAGRE